MEFKLDWYENENTKPSLNGTIKILGDYVDNRSYYLEWFNEEKNQWRSVGSIDKFGTVNVIAFFPGRQSRFQWSILTSDNRKTIATTDLNEMLGHSSNRSNVDDSYENTFKSIVLFPFRLSRWILIGIYDALIYNPISELIFFIIKFTFQFVWGLIVTIVVSPFALLILLITLFFMLPLRVFIFIITFGKIILWEDCLFDWFTDTCDYIFDSWV